MAQVLTGVPAVGFQYSGNGRRALRQRQRRVAIAFVLLAFLPLPTNSAIVLWALANVLAIASFIWGSDGRRRFLLALTMVGSTLVVVAAIRGLLLGVEPLNLLRDALDGVRFAPAIVAAYSLWRGGNRVDLTSVIAAVCLVDAAVSVAEFFVPGPFRLLYLAHGTEHHWSQALLISSRAAGLYASPGEHGAALAVFGIILLCRLLRRPSPLLLVGVLSAAASVLLSQSQTSFVAFAIGASLVLLWALTRLRLQPTRRAVRWLVVMAILVGPPVIAFVISRLRYLVFLFTTGSTRSSYRLRQELWDRLTDRWNDTSTSIVLGGGRTWLGRELTSVVESDLRFVLFVYGAAGLTLLVVGYLEFVQSGPVVRVEACVVGVMALVSSWASSFLADSRLLTVVVLTLVFHPRARPSEVSTPPPTDRRTGSVLHS